MWAFTDFFQEGIWFSDAGKNSSLTPPTPGSWGGGQPGKGEAGEGGGYSGSDNTAAT